MIANHTDRLDEIALAWNRFEEEVLDAQGVLTPELAEQHEALQLAERHKVDGLALYVQSLEQQEKGLKAIAARAKEKAGTVQNRIKWLKEYAGRYLDARGLTKVKGDLGYTVAWHGNGGLQPLEVLVDPKTLPANLQKVTVEADNDAIRRLAAAAGAENLVVNDVVIARLLPRGRHISIG